MPRQREYRKQDVGALISRIEIEHLFQTYSYVLDLTLTPNPESGKLMLLYGNNGSGKTTILNLLYHLLDPEPYGGHRSYVGRIPPMTIATQTEIRFITRRKLFQFYRLRFACLSVNIQA